MQKSIFSVILMLLFGFSGYAYQGHQNPGHQQRGEVTHQNAEHNNHNSHGGHTNACGVTVSHDGPYDAGQAAFHHIADQNIYTIGPFHFPLPVIIYEKDTKDFQFFSSGKFDANAHGIGKNAFNGYVLYEGLVRRVKGDFPKGFEHLGEGSLFSEWYVNEKGKKKEMVKVCHNGKIWETEAKSTLDGGMLGGGQTSFVDFSITKNVLSMIFILLFGLFIFQKIAQAYKKRDGKAPSGLQNFFEPIFLFIQEEVSKPFLGPKWEKYQPFIMSLFFFILFLNLFGQIPFLGGSNVTGKLSVTLVLALFTGVIVNFSGNKHYWQHIFNMPGVPKWVLVILTPVEMMGVLIKPLTLMIRLFGNIAAGHMVIAIFVGLIFVFGKSGQNVPASLGAAIGSTLLSLFMMAVELLVAVIQAFVFSILTASYIGAAVEEPHH